MRFCTNCGKELDDITAFCTGCGTATGTSSADTAQYGSSGIYTSATSGTSGTYTQSAAPSNQGGAYYQNAAPGGSYYQASTPPNQENPYYQAGMPNSQGVPNYQNSPYGGAPQYPGGRPGNNKALIIVIAAIVSVALIGVGIFTYFKLSGRKNTTSLSDNNSASTSTASSKPSDGDSEDSDSDDTDSGGLTLLDAKTQDNVIAACEEIGLDYKKIKNFESYSEGEEGSVYTFTYKGSVVDLFLYKNGTVFSIETGGTQVYLDGYESYSIDEYLGGTTHYDESYPSNGYVFFKTEQDVDSDITIQTSSDLDYAIELINANDDSLVIAFYAQAGGPCYMSVPAGDYYIRYAAGAAWRDSSELFGPDTLYYTSDSVYSVDPDNTSTIILDIYGGTGIPSTQISKDEF